MQGPLLDGKRAPPFKIACALALALWIVGCFALLLSALHAHHERTSEAHTVGDAHPGEIMLVTMAFPLSGMLVIVLLIPLIGDALTTQRHASSMSNFVPPFAVYIFEHAAFASLSMLRPDHYGR